MTRLRNESRRAWIAVAISLPLSFAASFVLRLFLPAPLGPFPAAMLGWVIWSVVYALLTLHTFGGASAERLAALVVARRVRAWRRVLGGVDGPGLAVQLAATALAAAALLPRVDAFAPEPGEGIVLTVLIVATVITSWIIVTLSYAVHYARCYIAGGGLDFPGDEQPGFRDFLYFSATVATTFGTTDVVVTSTRVRSVVTGHAVLTFVFNTFIIALMVAALTV